MGLPDVEVATSDCPVLLGQDSGTLEPGRSITVHLKDIPHSRWEHAQSEHPNDDLAGLGAVLFEMMTGWTDEHGEHQPKWSAKECRTVTATWPFRQLNPLATAVDELHNGPQVDNPLPSSDVAQLATVAALTAMQQLSDTPTTGD